MGHLGGAHGADRGATQPLRLSQNPRRLCGAEGCRAERMAALFDHRAGVAPASLTNSQAAAFYGAYSQPSAAAAADPTELTSAACRRHRPGPVGSSDVA